MSSSTSAAHSHLVQRLLKALNSTHVIQLSSSVLNKSSVLETPHDFHETLLRNIANASNNISLAALYIGTGATRNEEELLQRLSANTRAQQTLLMDANRGQRPVKTADKTGTTSSAESVAQRVPQASIYLHQTLQEPWKTILPSPLDEVMGVFHLKAYITDDDLILSGANLSQEYFEDRQDRYIVFHGGGELTKFYRDLTNILCQNAYRYGDDGSPPPQSLQQLKTALTQLYVTSRSEKRDPAAQKDTVAYAIPTFQHPHLNQLPFASDVQQLSTLLQIASEQDCTVFLASAYLNPTPTFQSKLQACRHCTLLTASPSSHGFAPKPGVRRKGDFVPHFFGAHSMELADQHHHVVWYHRPGWTFHAKGMWILSPQGHLVAAVVGSGNYGYRSEQRDVESNVILVFPETDSEIQQALLEEWHQLCAYAEEPKLVHPVPRHVKALWPWIQSFF
jgi:CDP-diacylglycerol--glycerol-3-phosphate 3-phosphatidyltransferase